MFHVINLLLNNIIWLMYGRQLKFVNIEMEKNIVMKVLSISFVIFEELFRKLVYFTVYERFFICNIIFVCNYCGYKYLYFGNKRLLMCL